jgi:hypothetical protein
MNRAAQSLGRLARGVPKKYSAEEIAKRTSHCAAMTKARWAGHVKKSKKILTD